MSVKYGAIAITMLVLSGKTATAQELKVLSPVVVTGTRTEQDSFDLPMSIDKISKPDISDGQLRMTLSESLARVPGITAQSRTQMAQDPQISSRGFGARSSFGVRGIRVYVDGIPLSMPDGSSNPGSVDLGMMDGIEVMRGPFSALYGSSSGGVIHMLTGGKSQTPELSADALYGSFNTRRESTSASGSTANFDYLIGISNYLSDGYRDQSANDKQQSTAKLGFKLSEYTQLTTLMNWFDQSAADPGGLKRTAASREPSAFSSPTQTFTSAGSSQANTRVYRSNTQIGFNLEHKLEAGDTVNLISYAGHRDNLQYLSTSSTTTVGRASSISRDFYGFELKHTGKGVWRDQPYELTYGLTYGGMQDNRMDKATLLGEITAAGEASPTRNENQYANNTDVYVQAMYALDPKWNLHAGMRYSSVNLEIADKDGTPVTGSGSLNFSKVIPVAGLVYKLSPAVNLYANAGLGFETPTLVEITYLDPASSSSGPNLTLVPSTSQNFEFGVKSFLSDSTTLNAAVFRINTENEIVTKKLVGSTGSYKNAGQTKRAGLELNLDSELPHHFSTHFAYTYLNATFESDFTNASGVTVSSGNVIPGTYKQQAFAEVAWSYPAAGFQAALNSVYSSDVKVDDVNSDSAAAFNVLNLRTSLTQYGGRWTCSEYLTWLNLTDVQYIGSVKVNDANSRFFEPAARSNFMAGVKAVYRF
ncbi:MAG: TonB-dependent receptor [Betaproteobacteria bacterium]